MCRYTHKASLILLLMIFLFGNASLSTGNVPTFRLQVIYKGQRGGSFLRCWLDWRHCHGSKRFSLVTIMITPLFPLSWLCVACGDIPSDSDHADLFNMRMNQVTAEEIEFWHVIELSAGSNMPSTSLEVKREMTTTHHHKRVNMSKCWDVVCQANAL